MPNGHLHHAAPRRTIVVTVADRLDSTQRRLALTIVLGTSANAFEAMAVVGAMPAIADDLDGRSLYGVSFTVYMLCSLLAIIATGEMSDRIGPRRPFGVGVVLFVAGLLLAGAADSMGVFVAARALQGIGAGGVYGTVYVMVARGYPPSLRPRMFAIVSTAWVIPGVAGPLVAGALSDTVGWRWVFFGLAPMPIIAALVGWGPMGHLGRPETPDPTPSRLGSALALVLGLGTVVTGLQDDRLWVQAAATVGGLAVCHPAMQRLFPTNWWRAAPGLAAFVTLRLLANYGFFGTDTYIPFAVTEGHGTSNTAGAVTIMGATLSWTVGSWSQARLTDRWGSTRVARAGMVLVVAGIVLSAPVAWTSWPYPATFVTWAVAGLGMGLVYNVASVGALGSVDETRAGLVGSQLQVADNMGAALGIGLGGALVAAGERGSWSLTPTLFAVFALGAAAAVLGLLAAANARTAPGRACGAGPAN